MKQIDPSKPHTSRPGHCWAVERVEQPGQPNIVLECESTDVEPFDVTPYSPDGINGVTEVPLCAFHRDKIKAEWDAGLAAFGPYDPERGEGDPN